MHRARRTRSTQAVQGLRRHRRRPARVRPALDDDADRDRDRVGRDVRQARDPRVRQGPGPQHDQAARGLRGEARPDQARPRRRAREGAASNERWASATARSRSSPARAGASAPPSPSGSRARGPRSPSPPARSTSTRRCRAALRETVAADRGVGGKAVAIAADLVRRRRPRPHRPRGRGRARPGRHPGQQRRRRVLPPHGRLPAEAAAAQLRAQRARAARPRPGGVAGHASKRAGLDRQRLERDVEAPEGPAVRPRASRSAAPPRSTARPRRRSSASRPASRPRSTATASR